MKCNYFISTSIYYNIGDNINCFFYREVISIVSIY